jgi:hypothetical protein
MNLEDTATDRKCLCRIILFYSQGKRLFLLDEIFIIEDIRRGADQFEAHPRIALVAYGEEVLTMHDRLMRDAVSPVMDHFIDPGFRHRLAGKKDPAVLSGAAPMPGVATVFPQHGTVGGQWKMQVVFVRYSHFVRIL